MSTAGLSTGRDELEDERAFLLASLRDLDAERDAGDISPEDYHLLRDRYTARAAEVLRALAAEPPEGSAPDAPPTKAAGADSDAVTVADAAGTGAGTGRHRRRRLAVAGALVVFAGGALALVVSTTGARAPGATATGSPSLSRAQQIRQQLAQATTLEASGQVVDALSLYRKVLQLDSTQPQALAESGWLEFQAGVQAKAGDVITKAQQTEQAAVRAAPDAYAPHLYLGSMLLAEGDAQGAVIEFRAYLADHPPASSVAVAEPFVTRAFTQAGLTPPALPGG